MLFRASFEVQNCIFCLNLFFCFCSHCQFFGSIQYFQCVNLCRISQYFQQDIRPPFRINQLSRRQSTPFWRIFSEIVNLLVLPINTLGELVLPRRINQHFQKRQSTSLSYRSTLGKMVCLVGSINIPCQKQSLSHRSTPSARLSTLSDQCF